MLIAEIEKNLKEVIRIEISEFKGKNYLNIRLWYMSEDGEYKPSPKGISLPVSKAENISEALKKSVEYIKENNL